MRNSPFCIQALRRSGPRWAAARPCPTRGTSPAGSSPRRGPPSAGSPHPPRCCPPPGSNAGSRGPPHEANRWTAAHGRGPGRRRSRPNRRRRRCPWRPGGAGRMHSDAQFAGSSSVPAHVEMMGFLGIGNNPMVGCTVACAVDVATALNK